MTPEGEAVRRGATDARSEVQKAKSTLSAARRRLDRIDRRILQDRRYGSLKNDVDYAVRSAERALDDLIYKLDRLTRTAQ